LRDPVELGLERHQLGMGDLLLHGEVRVGGDKHGIGGVDLCFAHRGEHVPNGYRTYHVVVDEGVGHVKDVAGGVAGGVDGGLGGEGRSGEQESGELAVGDGRFQLGIHHAPQREFLRKASSPVPFIVINV
jgi:hypothetical protein